MATDLDGIFNVGLKGIRDTKVFDEWLTELRKLNIGKASSPDGHGVYHEEEGEWEYDTYGFGGNDPYETDDPSFPFQVIFEGPYMYKVILSDDIAQLPTFHRLKILFEQPCFFENFINEIHRVVSIFGATEITWLSSLGSASYSAIYQSQVWENVPYEVVKESLLKEYGQPMNYQEAKKYEEDFGITYSELDRFVVDKFR
jgi:hypothetical protein